MSRPAYLQPANLLLRFALEVYALWAMLSYPLYVFDGWYRVAGAILFPLLASLIWGIFRVPNDGGKPLVQLQGKARLLIEFLFFSMACLAFFARGEALIAGIFLGVVLAHYLYSRQRVYLLWKNEPLEAPLSNRSQA